LKTPKVCVKFFRFLAKFEFHRSVSPAKGCPPVDGQ
jgi:hypothetical protein